MTMKTLLPRLAMGLAALGVFLGGASAGAAPPQAVAGPPAGFRIAGYLPDYRMDLVARIDGSGSFAGLTDLVLFSAEPSPSGSLDVARLARTPWAELRQWKQRHSLRLILAVGGWQRSAHFAGLARSADMRRVFVESAVTFCEREQLDGLDFDWEHPRDAEEEAGYGQLLREVHAACRPRELVVSVTIAPWQHLPQDTWVAVDWVQVMAYDHEGRHATLPAARQDISTLIQAGVPVQKLVLGLPFYGRGIQRPDQTLSYQQIVEQHTVARESDEIGDLYYNGPETLCRKVQFAREAGLAGVMIWELGQDAPGDKSLLAEILRAVGKSNR